MLSQRWRPVFFAAIAVLAVWAFAITGVCIAKNARLTADKLRSYVATTDLNRLSEPERNEAIRKLASRLNRLSLEERQRAQFEHVPRPWFEQMTGPEKSLFLQLTTPNGFQQMLTAFEQLPEDRRRRTIEDALRRWREAQSRLGSEDGISRPGTNALSALRPELIAKIRAMGLAEFFNQSSPETRAELTPVLEELQRVMETGRPFRGR